MENREKYHLQGKLGLPELYEEMPHLDEVDPEFMFDVFFRAKEVLEEQEIEVDSFNLLRCAKRLAVTDFKKEFMTHSPPMHQFHLSLIDPGMEVLRYLPRVTQRLGINPNREFKPLWEYVEPDFMTRLNFGHWNKVSHILDDLPELAEELRTLEEKPMFFLVNKITDHGTVGNIIGKDFAVSVRANLDEHDVPNALHFSGNMGPKVLQVTDKWIVEQYFKFPFIEEYDQFETSESFLYGNLLGAALRRIHNEGYSYNASLRQNVFIDPTSNNLHVRNFCDARKDGNFEGDLINVKNLLREKYLQDVTVPLDRNTYLSSYGNLPYLQAYKGFIRGYEKGEHLPLVMALNRKV